MVLINLSLDHPFLSLFTFMKQLNLYHACLISNPGIGTLMIQYC